MNRLRHLISVRPLASFALLALTVTFIFVANNSSDLWSGFTLWAVAPCVATLALGLLLPRSTQTGWFSVCVAVPALMGPILYLYASNSAAHADAQFGLVFLMVPLWQFVALLVIWSLAFVVRAAQDTGSGA